ncbi:hypothetical protein ONZ45_g13289 [Pleurotus djamor]|nr:hypothetical protein ONZ45_g13289 [Pleurotus djamor]
MSSRASTPRLCRDEDESPPQMPAPFVDERQRIREALFEIDCPHKNTEKGRNLVINIDGTANQFSQTSTNVVELFSRLIKDLNQRVYYDSGIGTYTRRTLSWSYIKQVVDHKIDTAIAWNFEKIVHAAYKWLSENYEPGDRIFLFGFSRGAYQVRVIAGMIEKVLQVGLLHKGNDRQIPFAYELYCSVTGNSPRDTRVSSNEPPPNTSVHAQPRASDANVDCKTNGNSIWSGLRAKFLRKRVCKTNDRADVEHKLCAQFKRSLCHDDVKVHFVGAWDTVSSIGVFRGKSFPETVSGMTHVCHFRHALALDERRAKFQPEFVNGGLGPLERENGANRGDVKEVWFAGSHSDIGGGNISNEDLNNFGPSLRWMTCEAMACGLRVKPYLGKWLPVVPKESLKGFWKALEYLPFSALSYRDESSLTWRPHRGAPRLIQPGQLIHESVFNTPPYLQFRSYFYDTESLLSDNSSHGSKVSSNDDSQLHPVPYIPKAVFNDSTNFSGWEHLFSVYSPLKHLNIIEQDPYDNASHVLGSLALACLSLESGSWDAASALNSFNTNLLMLQSFLNDASLIEVPSSGGTLLTALCVAVHHREAATTLDTKETLICLISKSRLVPTTARLPTVSQICQWASNIRRIYWDDLFQVLKPFGCIGFQRHDQWVVKVTFSNENPERIILITSPDGNASASVWDGSGRTPQSLIHIPGGVATVSGDGSYVAVSPGKEINTARTTTERPLVVRGTDQGDSIDVDVIWCLGFSDNHQVLASGHANGWIKLWKRDASQWKVYQKFRGGANRIWCLAFSKDGSALVFRVWYASVKVRGLAGDTLVELDDSGDSCSLTWNPHGDTIASGTYHGYVKIWTSDLGKLEHTFKAHDDCIEKLSFRHDGQVLATGSHDQRIRGWRRDTWEKIWEFDVGEVVLSIAFSPDGKRLVSGGEFGALHLWDIDMGENEEVD